MFLITGFSCTILCGQTVSIRLVNGRTGRPIPNSFVNVWVGNQRKEATVIPTDKDGIAKLELTDIPSKQDASTHQSGGGSFVAVNPVLLKAESISVNVGFVRCTSRKVDHSWLLTEHYSTETLVHDGIVTANTCGNSSASPKPGELTVFVRPLNLLEKFEQ